MIEILGLIGITLIVSTGNLTESFRYWLLERFNFLGKFLSCSMCIGFWIGNSYSFFIKNECSFVFRSLINDLLFGGAIALLAFTTDVFLNFMKSKYELLWESSATNQSRRETEKD